ncbi:MAG: PDZ domain-containing protein [Ruminiclostridium sp.]|nr:PDZ domain-containing protein [Ruminiclostridium sp.]
MKIKKSLLCLMIFMVLQMVLAVPVCASDYSDYIDNIIDMAKERYYQYVSDDKLLKGALKGIFQTMDEYTTFYTLDEATSFLDTLEGNYQGIGVEISQVSEGVVVIRVFANSPAEGAGIFAEDRIVRVNGKDIAGFTSAEVASLIKGEAGTFVELGILRGNSNEILNFRVERGTVNISPVTWRVDGDVMYIRLDSFSSNSARFFEQALKEMNKRGLWKMVLDLRNNPGGEVFQAVSIARSLVKQGIITTLDFKSEKQNDIVYESYLTKTKYLPAILVNGNTASASEILASAVQESGDGFLIGTKTYGKGVVQNVLPILSPEAYERYLKEYGQSSVDAYDWINEYGVNVKESDLIGWTKITTGHYLTRSGNQIDGIGLEPDFPVADPQRNTGIDVQAVKSLQSTASIALNGVGNEVFDAEKILLLKGYEIEVVDNELDENTCEILKQFQKQKEIQVTGILDEATKKALNEELEELRLSLDTQYAKARELLSLLKY